MKIKTKKQMNLLELIQGVWEGDVKTGERKSDYGNTVFIWSLGLETYKGVRIQADEVFTVEVEEIVTPTTRFDELTEYIYDANDGHHFTAKHKGANISMIIDCETHQFKTQAIYCKDTLIWNKEHGIPEEGVLEVDEE